MTDQTTSPPIVPDQHFQSVMALVALLADPAAAAARVTEIRDHQATLQGVIDALQEARAEHEKARVAVVTAETASKARIAAEQTKHAQACAERERALNVRETAIARIEAETKRDREAARKLKSNLEAKLAAVSAAARDAAA
jgi:chromosome segregation ATPase